jgi:hypothetical protein
MTELPADLAAACPYSKLDPALDPFKVISHQVKQTQTATIEDNKTETKIETTSSELETQKKALTSEATDLDMWISPKMSAKHTLKTGEKFAAFLNLVAGAQDKIKAGDLKGARELLDQAQAYKQNFGGKNVIVATKDANVQRTGRTPKSTGNKKNTQSGSNIGVDGNL